MKLLPCLSHCFSSHVMGLYQQWTLVILYDFDYDRVVPFLFLDAIYDFLHYADFKNVGSIVMELYLWE